MNSPTTQKLIVILITLGLIGFLVYSVFISPAAPNGNTEQGASGVVGEDILSLVAKLNTLSFDPSLFKSALFTGLLDFSIPLVPEQQGRDNPFAPVVGVVGR